MFHACEAFLLSLNFFEIYFSKAYALSGVCRNNVKLEKKERRL